MLRGPKSEKNGMYLRSLSTLKKNARSPFLPLGGSSEEIQKSLSWRLSKFFTFYDFDWFGFFVFFLFLHLALLICFCDSDFKIKLFFLLLLQIFYGA
jgi:hypothetical protein